VKLKTTPAMRARCRELTRQGGTDDYDSVVQMLLDDFDLLLASIGQTALQPQGPTTADDAVLIDALLDAHSNYQHAHEGSMAEHRADFKKARAAVLARMSGVPEGWKMVPVEPTEEMLNAAIDAHGLKIGCIAPLGLRMSPQMMFEKSYAAMLAAAPTEVK
jgi:hypothetical protein